MTIYYARSYYGVRSHNKEVEVGDVFKDSSKSGRWLVVTEIHDRTPWAFGVSTYIPYVVCETVYNNETRPAERFLYEVLTGPRSLSWIKGNFNIRPATPVPVVRKEYFVGRGLPRYREKEYVYA